MRPWTLSPAPWAREACCYYGCWSQCQISVKKKDLGIYRNLPVQRYLDCVKTKFESDDCVKLETLLGSEYVFTGQGDWRPVKAIPNLYEGQIAFSDSYRIYSDMF